MSYLWVNLYGHCIDDKFVNIHHLQNETGLQYSCSSETSNSLDITLSIVTKNQICHWNLLLQNIRQSKKSFPLLVSHNDTGSE